MISVSYRQHLRPQRKPVLRRFAAVRLSPITATGYFVASALGEGAAAVGQIHSLFGDSAREVPLSTAAATPHHF